MDGGVIMSYEEKLNKLEKILINKGVPYKRNGNQFSVALLFQEDLERFAEQVGLLSDD
jgi:hypothetical protein